MHILIFKKNHLLNTYTVYNSGTSSICFLADLYEDDWLNTEFISKLLTYTTITYTGDMVICFKNGDEIVLSSIDVIEDNLFFICSIHFLIYIIKQFERLQSLESEEIIFLIDSPKINVKSLYESQSAGISFYNERINYFAVHLELLALMRLLCSEIELNKIITWVNSKDLYYHDNFFYLKHYNQEIIIEYIVESKNYFNRTILLKEVFVWILKIFIELIQHSFEQLLLYRTPDRYVFIVDIDKEIIFFLKPPEDKTMVQKLKVMVQKVLKKFLIPHN